VLDLSPTKLLIILVVVVVLLGPKRLPEVARQLGAGWRKVREYHLRFDRELRQQIPDLPSSHDLVRFARSPVSLLNQLADRHDEPSAHGDGDAAGGSDGVGGDGHGRERRDLDAAGARAGMIRPSGLAHPPIAALDADDPNLN
jgi:TatA/E family protein of Tat protein translocase